MARQYCGQLGKRANCQLLVLLTLAQGEVPVGLRLFLPDNWMADPERCARAGVPEAEVVARTKGEIALAELDRARAAGVRFGCVLANAGHGTNAAFRHGLDERGLVWAVGIARKALAAAIKARWVCEQAHQQLKGELGLGHFEVRSWIGRHRHALMTCIAHAYLQHLRLAGQPRTGPGESATPRSGAAIIAQPARRAPGHHG